MSFIDTDNPFSIAAKRIRSSVIRSTPEPQLPIQGKQQPTTYIIEPDLMESQTGKMNLPNDVAFDDAGFAYNTVTGNPVQVVRRPNVLPIAKTPDGFTPVMPKMLDIVGNVMGNVGGLAGGKVAANAGELVLGSGVVRTKGNNNLINKIVKSYNDRLPSIEDQYYNWAGKDYDYQVLNKTDFKTMYGDDVSDWPIEAKNLFKSNDEIIQINTPNETKYFSKDNAPSLKDHMKDVVSSQDGLFEAGNLNDIMKGLALKVHGAEEAASDAFKILAKEKGWEVGKGVRYFTISKGDDVKNIRISDHKNLTKSNPNASNVDINIAPGAHNFNDALTLLSDTRPQVAAATGHALEKQNQPFFSALERTVDNAKIGKADANQWLGYLKNQPGVKQEELSWVLNNLPEGQISKQALGDIIKNNKIELKEVVKGGSAGTQEKAFELAKEHGWKSWDDIDEATQRKYIRRAAIEGGANPTKYHNYQLPGGERYQEMLLTLPGKKFSGEITSEEFRKAAVRMYGEKYADSLSEAQKEIVRKDIRGEYGVSANDFKSSHWDEPNILAHVRHNDRNIPDVGKSLHLEEIQSDWHQAGRKQGYKDPKVEAAINRLKNETYTPEDLELIQTAGVTDTKNYQGVPDAPFKKNWDELAFKRMLHKAANEGYDSVSWTPGEAQAARYDLSKQISKLQYFPGRQRVQAFDKNGNSVIDKEGIKPDQLPDIVGKEVANKLLSDEFAIKKNFGDGGVLVHEMRNADLKIGGEGMKSFYDKMLVDKANSLAKKYGAKVETKTIPLNTSKTSYNDILKKVNMTSEEWKALSAEERAAKLNEIGFGQPIHVLKLTPELRAKAKEGFPLFSSTPITTPVDYDPFNNNKKYKLTPIQGDPFQ